METHTCATNLLEDGDGGGVQDAAMRALAMAKDMIIEATEVTVPSLTYTQESWKNYTVQIRVGIHVGDVTCGVLGQRLPKFTTCGKGKHMVYPGSSSCPDPIHLLLICNLNQISAVNMAARMEQNSQASCIRVTKDFHDTIGDAEKGWKPKEVIPLKNMGDMETYLLDPLEMRIGEALDYFHPCQDDDDCQ